MSQRRTKFAWLPEIKNSHLKKTLTEKKKQIKSIDNSERRILQKLMYIEQYVNFWSPQENA